MRAHETLRPIASTPNGTEAAELSDAQSLWITLLSLRVRATSRAETSQHSLSAGDGGSFRGAFPGRKAHPMMLGGHERMMTTSKLVAEYGRQAAYRRLALTILGLDIQSLLRTLPVRHESGPTPRAGRYTSCDTPRLASIAATRLASGWRSRAHTRPRSGHPAGAATSARSDPHWRWPGSSRLG